MENVSLLLAGGMNSAKAQKTIDLLKENLEKMGIQGDILFVNTYEVKCLKEYEQDRDFIISAGTGNLTARLPVFDGLCLLYPWMGAEKLYQQIKTFLEERSSYG